MTPCWRLPVAAYSDAGHSAAFDEVDRDVYWVSGSGSGRKRIRLNKKLLHTLRLICLILVLGFGRG